MKNTRVVELNSQELFRAVIEYVSKHTSMQVDARSVVNFRNAATVKSIVPLSGAVISIPLDEPNDEERCGCEPEEGDL